MSGILRDTSDAYRTGADALVLFNRFLQPDIDPDTLAAVPQVGLSSRDGGPAAGRARGSRSCTDGCGPRSRRPPASRPRPTWPSTSSLAALIEIRLACAVPVLLVFAASRSGWRAIRDAWRPGPGLVLGVLNAAVPFTLIAWGERYVDSGVAAIANSSVRSSSRCSRSGSRRPSARRERSRDRSH